MTWYVYTGIYSKAANIIILNRIEKSEKYLYNKCPYNFRIISIFDNKNLIKDFNMQKKILFSRY